MVVSLVVAHSFGQVVYAVQVRRLVVVAYVARAHSPNPESHVVGVRILYKVVFRNPARFDV